MAIARQGDPEGVRRAAPNNPSRGANLCQEPIVGWSGSGIAPIAMSLLVLLAAEERLPSVLPTAVVSDSGGYLPPHDDSKIVTPQAANKPPFSNQQDSGVQLDP
jgi:hypothetical protein